MGHARAIMGAETGAQQRAAWRRIVSQNLSVRAAEALVKRLKAQKREPKPPAASSTQIYLQGLADDLSRRFGTNVKIVRRGQKGRLEIAFFGDDDLDRLITILKKSA
jgi:ParB family chromosome partitioning protein